MKKALFLLLGLFLVWLLIRFVIGGDEDSWICVDDQWVKHGQPSSLPPKTGCGENEEVPRVIEISP